MAAFILVLGLLQMAAGAFVGITAPSPVHQILGTVAFGLGVVAFALAVIIAKIDDYVKDNRV